MLVARGCIVGTCVLLVIAMVRSVGANMVVVGREHEGHIQDGLVTYREMPEHSMCERLDPVET